MDDLVRWLGKQLDADAAGVEAATWADDATTWHAAPSPYDTWGKSERWYVEDAMEEGVITHVDPKAAQDEGVARHIAEHDPARVLREIDGRRRTLVRMSEVLKRGWDYYENDTVIELARETLLDLASTYSHRPGYAEAVASAE